MANGPNIANVTGTVTYNGKSSASLTGSLAIDGVTVRFDPADKSARRLVQVGDMTVLVGPGVTNTQSNGKTQVEVKNSQLFVNGKQVDPWSGGAAKSATPSAAKAPKWGTAADGPVWKQGASGAKKDSASVTIVVTGSKTEVSIGGKPAQFAQRKVGNLAVQFQPGKDVPHRTVSVAGSTFQMGQNMSMQLNGVKVDINGNQLSLNGMPVDFSTAK